VLVCAPLVLVSACKGDRATLEQLVPDGATGITSIDAKGLVRTDLFTTIGEGMGDAGGEAKRVLDRLRDECELDLEKTEAVVFGADALSQNAMGAIRLPNVGKADALRCLDAVAKDEGGRPLLEVSEADGKATVSIEGGEAQGWAMDDDTLVLSSKGWASAVQARMKGESKGAVDNNLAEAVAMADRSKHMWLAGEVPGLVEPFLKETPAAGIRRGAASLHYGEELEIAVAVAFADEAAAKTLEDAITPKLEEFEQLAVTAGLPQKAADSVEIEVDGAVVRGKLALPMAPLFEQTTAPFQKYMRRSKTAEARVQIAKMFDAASAYFMEEHVSRAEVAVLGAGGAITGSAPHRCPNDGSKTGHAGVTPPLSVDCSKGPGGRCVPVTGEPSGPGEYSMSLWSGNQVWSALNFQQEQPHYFHYDFRWSNGDTDYGDCQFTAQAFGDLDGDQVYSTYERAGAADQNGVNAPAGLFIEQEVE